MQRVQTLLQKITELSTKEQHDIIEIDLMMDYTRVLYADLMECRNRLVFTGAVPQPETTPPNVQPVVQETIPEPEIATIPTQEETTPAYTEQLTYTPEAETAALQQVYEPKHEALATSISTAQPTTNGDGITSLIGINDKYQFMNELFNNNREDYESVIDELETFENYPQAVSWLNTYVGNRYNWDADSETVQSFHSIIERYYNSK